MANIIPPPELVQQWVAEIWHEGTPVQVAADHLHIATQAARWGADQELNAVCDDIRDCIAGIYENEVTDWSELVNLLRYGRRPKPPSLKEQALALLDDASDRLDAVHENTIRRALEALDD